MSQNLFTKFPYIIVYENKLQELKRIELMTYSAFSLDITFTDFHLFWSMAYFLYLQCFINLKEEEASVKEFIALKDNNWYKHGIKELAERWFLPVYNFDLSPSDYQGF